MTVKEVLDCAAFLLGKEETQAYLKQSEAESTPQVQRETELLLRCYNIVENEIALDYLPLTAEESFIAENGTIPYTAFSRFPVSVSAVTDEYGNALPYYVFPEYLKVRTGKAVVAYSYAPAVKSLSDECEYRTGVSARLIAYGVACEYCLVDGRYEEAVTWDKKYKDALLCAASAVRPRVVRSRRWV